MRVSHVKYNNIKSTMDFLLYFFIFIFYPNSIVIITKIDFMEIEMLFGEEKKNKKSNHQSFVFHEIINIFMKKKKAIE